MKKTMMIIVLSMMVAGAIEAATPQRMLKKLAFGGSGDPIPWCAPDDQECLAGMGHTLR